ncbi:MAG: division plane positioning ATPase MipZ [Qipengyuania sp.]
MDRLAWQDGEHPQIVIDDVAGRLRPHGHVITFANEKGGVGKSTLAFQTAVALAHRGQRVVAIDLDRNQQTLERALVNREGSAKNLRTRLPMPRHAALDHPATAQLLREIQRLDTMADFIVIDAAGADSPIMRRTIAMADTLVTPVNCSFVDLDVLGQIDPVTGRSGRAGHFAGIVGAIREERLRNGLPDCDWLVVRNRLRRQEKRQQARIGEALGVLGRSSDFRIATPLRERVVFRDLFQFGLTRADLSLIPGAPAGNRTKNADIDHLLDEMRLDYVSAQPHLRPVNRVAVFERVGTAYREALLARL